MDCHFFEEVNEVVQAEFPDGQDPEILGLLASIGIKKGTPFIGGSYEFLDHGARQP